MRYIELCYAWIVVLLSSKKQLLHIWQLMNGWEWPFRHLGNYYKSLPDYNEESRTDKYRWYRRLFNYIKNKNTEFDKLHYHNVIFNKRMTEKEFFEWFYTDHQLPLSERAIKILKMIHDAGDDGLHIE